MKNINSTKYWDYFLNFIASEYDPEVYRLVIRTNKFLSCKNNVFTIISPSSTIKKLINNQFKDKLQTLMMAESGQKIEIQAVVNEDVSFDNLKNGSIIVSSQEQEIQNAVEKLDSYVENQSVLSKLQDKYAQIYSPDSELKFNNFVRGKSNEIAYVGASKFLEKNNNHVLFIYGSSGLGKTHLLSAVANQAISLGQRVAYMKANDFVEQYTGAIGHFGTFSNSPNSVDEFVSILNSVDLLVLDDIQGFNGKVESSNTLFNIFDHLRKNGKKIVLAADVTPSALNGIHERLITRFSHGLVLQVIKPSVELVVKFLRNKIRSLYIQDEELVFADEALETLAITFGKDFRTIEGVLLNLSTHMTINFPKNNLVDNFYLKETVLGETIVQEKIQSSKIVRVVANEYHIEDEQQLIGKSRKQMIKEGRNLAIWLHRRHLDLSYKQIGIIFGGRDHSTIMHSEKRINLKLKKDNNFKEFVMKLDRKVKT